MLRQYVGINEAVTTLLLNYVALDLMLFLIYDRVEGPQRHRPADHPGAAGGRAAAAHRRQPGARRASFIAARRGRVIVVVLALDLVGLPPPGRRRQRRGGPPGRAAGRRAAAVGAWLVGGALAGLGGFIQLAGAEFKLRPGFIATYGYIGFLASWLGPPPADPGRRSPSLLLSPIAVGGDSLQIDSELPGRPVNILMALVLLGGLRLRRTSGRRLTA